jgi:hypothetical protein
VPTCRELVSVELDACPIEGPTDGIVSVPAGRRGPGPNETEHYTGAYAVIAGKLGRDVSDADFGK